MLRCSLHVLKEQLKLQTQCAEQNKQLQADLSLSECELYQKLDDVVAKQEMLNQRLVSFLPLITLLQQFLMYFPDVDDTYHIPLTWQKYSCDVFMLCGVDCGWP